LQRSLAGIFQFLQGTVQTSSVSVTVAITLALFQFLQGTVQTIIQLVSISDRKIFQFLQGTVQTEKRSGKHGKIIEISIPPRYGTNSNDIETLTNLFRFQFLQGTVQTTIEVSLEREVVKFQFLQGTVQTDKVVGDEAFRTYFNSSKVRYKR